MHLLETDASTSAIQLLKDSQMLQNSKEKLSMTKTQKRIGSMHPPSIEDAVRDCDRFSTSKCMAFTNSAAIFNFGDNFDAAKTKMTPQTTNHPEKECSFLEGAESVSRISTCENRKSSLNGFINGFIFEGLHKSNTEERSDTARQSTTNPPEKHRHSVCGGVIPSTENKNSNNNRIDYKKQSCCDQSNHDFDIHSRLSDNMEYLGYRQLDYAEEEDGCKAMSGSDILKRMYEYFGSCPKQSKVGVSSTDASNVRRSPGSQVRKHGSCSLKNEYCCGLSSGGNTKSRLSGKGRPATSSIKSSDRANSICNNQDGDIQTQSCGYTKSDKKTPKQSFIPTEQNEIRPRSYELEPNTSPHLIDSLLPRKRKALESSGVPQSFQRQHTKKDSFNGSSKEHVYQKQCRDPKRALFHADANVNEISHEAKRMRAERIETTTPQDHQPHCGFPPLQPYPWRSQPPASEFPASIACGSLPRKCVGAALTEQALLAKHASLGGAMNPLFLSLNPCIMNPYLLCNLGSTEIMTAAAYHQALAQGLLQNHPAVNHLLSQRLMTNPVLYSGLNPLMYGLTETSPIATAIAESVKHNAVVLHPNAKTSYLLPPQPCNQHENSVRSIPVPVCPLPSPRSSPDSTRMNGRKDECRVRCSLSGESRKTGYHDQGRNQSLSVEIPVKTTNNSATAFGLKSKSPSSTSANLPNHPKKKLRALKMDEDCRAININKPNHEEGCKAPVVSVEKSRNSEKTLTKASSYKNLTRERRLVANARERTRVHTISSAFEELRQQIPSYSCNQKLSKLAILRIACSYIQSLSVLAGRNAEGTFEESVDQCTRVLQAESMARSRRKNNKAQIEWEVANYERNSNFDYGIRQKTDDLQRSPEAAYSVNQQNPIAYSQSNEPRNPKPGELRCSSHEHSKEALSWTSDTHLTDTDGGDLIANAAEDDSLFSNVIQGGSSPMNFKDCDDPWKHRADQSPECTNGKRDTWLGDNVEGKDEPISLVKSLDFTSQHNSDDQQNDLINVED